MNTFTTILIPAVRMRIATAHWIPIKALLTSSKVRNQSNTSDIANMMINDGNTTPSVANTEPSAPPFL